ncbi:homing endonuclease associated repeat-containing protein [Exiguobacterium sp. AB2]|uniref:homing endonuclease associated repeat-containing protein n=1 Tax=Exiguobacterium sp. AB2 TaxID=1484479 RepID=UPI0004A88DD3|nr:hypothetical protein [Exiguobacterium sp. AB2]KDN59462.1 hypothetical protein DI14_08220 [Exiguobacterium sp. AB2]
MKRWTEQQILSCLQQAANELDEFDTKHYTLWARSKDVPSLSTVIYKFGSWREAVQAADIKMMYRYYSDEDILTALNEAAEELDIFTSQTYREWAKIAQAPSLTLISSRFGSWSNALREAKLQTTTARNNEERIIQALIEASAELERLTSQHYAVWAQVKGYPTVATIARKYGSWSYALFVLDIAPPKRKWDEDDVIDALRLAKDELNHFSILHYRKWAEGRNVPSTSTINALFGSWTAALRCMEEQKVMQ